MVPIFQVTLKVAVWAFLSTKYSCEKGDDVIKSWLYAVTTFIVCVILGWAIHTATFVDGHGVEPELTCMWVAPGHGFTLKWCITMTSQWEWWRLKSPASRVFSQPFLQAQIKENIKAPRHWPLCVEFTGHRWTTKGQWRGKCCNLMTSCWRGRGSLAQGVGDGLDTKCRLSLLKRYLIGGLFCLILYRTRQRFSDTTCFVHAHFR